ncbi:hypothetical protein EFV37_13200 [Mesorhizobium loti]|uniref:Uncharacterized protein n=1 Tax=Mesorhizobium jarvisii TaxID=1777867 RepID=A0A6M7TDN1_9HYPH|nr:MULTISPECIES: hypothetical protein [Mesorhizobium]OBQ58039.1 hypothetical protein A9K72_27940 [Mesorhizobium loti]QKC63151.1 hypothetical protein EB229_13190 [Mesorhizobium jarvisii]QKD09062.1 hypothetical protein EFV37_13200 [Mesorhizobium loti]RJT30158.1 hypothetical protein D3242_25925 [Mesorhizobium jarvisii]
MSKVNFGAFKNAWLDQVAADNTLAPLAFKLGWHFMKDCGRTLSKQGTIFSFRSQDGYAELLGIGTRHVRDLFTALRDRGHIAVKRAGKGNPNRTYPTLFDRQYSSGQNPSMTGTSVPFDRHSHDIMTGTKGPGNLIEEIPRGESGGGAKPTARLHAASIRSSLTLDVDAEGDARAPHASHSSRSDDSFNHEPWRQDDDEGTVEYDGPEDEPGVGGLDLWSE